MVDYQGLKEAELPQASAVPGMVSKVLKKKNKQKQGRGDWYLMTDFANAFRSTLSLQKSQPVCLHLGRNPVYLYYVAIGLFGVTNLLA